MLYSNKRRKRSGVVQRQHVLGTVNQAAVYFLLSNLVIIGENCL